MNSIEPITTARKSAPGIFSLPTYTELRACWDLCRLNNNMGCWLILLPTLWSMGMAYHNEPTIPGLLVLHRAAAYALMCSGVKSLIMTIDDILDRDIDAEVERTKNRALCRGDITPVRAWIFFSLQCVLGMWLAKRYLSPTSLYISMFVWPIFVIYPTCKRWTFFAPIPLGIMFNVGAFMGWADLADIIGHPSAIAWPTLFSIFIGSFLWTITYETVYQHQDKLEDVSLDLKSLAIYFGSKYTVPTCSVTGTGFIMCLAYAGYLNNQGWIFYVSLAIAAWMLLSRLFKTDVDVPKDCLKFFCGNPFMGQVILAGLMGDAVYSRFLQGVPL